MRNLFKIVFLLVVLSIPAVAQFDSSAAAGQAAGQIEGTLGPIWINGNPYYSLRLRPEFGLGKIGVGLDLNLEFDAHGTLRRENFNEVSDYISVIRYVRYGTEFDPLFIRLGALDYATLGHGSIINQYNNSPSFDTRKTGMQLNINGDQYGVQTLYGNFGQAGVAGLRGYVRPLTFTSLSMVPIISNIEIGATYATDFDKYARAFSTAPIGTPNSIVTNGAMSIYGVDIDFPLLNNPLTGIDLYTDYTKIVDFGSGVSTGLAFRFDLSALLKVRSKLERRFNGDQYIAGYFDNFYEIERFNAQLGYGKALGLAFANGDNNGYYGDLLVNVVGMFDIFGSFQKLDKAPNSGILHLTTSVMPEGAPYVARAGYDKINIIDMTDLFTTDDRSYLYAELGYRPVPYLIASMRYSWSFTPIRADGDTGDIIGYTPQRKIEPRLTLVYKL